LFVASACLSSNFAIHTIYFNMTEFGNFWPEIDAMSEGLYSTTPRVIGDDEPQTVLQSDPAAWDEDTFPIPENDYACSDERLISYDGLFGSSKPKPVQSEAMELSTDEDPGHCFWDDRTPFLWIPSSELPLDSPSTLGRQLSVQAGLSNDDTFSTASSVTLQGDDMSQPHNDEEDDEDYEETTFLYETLCRYGQEALDTISKLCETLPQIEISWEALELGAYPVEDGPAAVHKLSRDIDALIGHIEILDTGLGTLNKLAAMLDVPVDMINDRAWSMKKEIQDMGLYAWKAAIEAYKHELPTDFVEDHTPVSHPSPQWSLHEEPDVHNPDIGFMDLNPSYTRTETPSYRECSCCASPDLSLFGAASLDDPPPQHAGRHGPSVEYIHDHSTPQSYPYIFNPNEPYEYPSGPSQAQNEYLYPDWRNDRTICTPQTQQCSCERCNSNNT
jgi:hypothetical protein